MAEQLMSEDDLQEVRRYLETTPALADGRALGYLKRLLADRRVLERHVDAVCSATFEEAAKVCEEEFQRDRVPEGHAITRKQSAMDCAARIRARLPAAGRHFMQLDAAVSAPPAAPADSTLLDEAERADELLIRRARIAAGTAWGPNEHQGVSPETAAANEREVRRILRECANRIESPEAAARRFAERDSAR
jgi:hypothetical protein